MEHLLNRLPIEIIHHILSYSYKPQPVHLQKDIISYVTNKQVINDIFHRRYHVFTDNHSINNHFTFHIHCFLTGIPNTYADCENKKSEICNRIFMHHKLNTNSPLTYCVFWGLLTVEEREQFVDIQKKMVMEQMS
jgi:hypothetical protein